jgi:hypothetical protein
MNKRLNPLGGWDFLIHFVSEQSLFDHHKSTGASGDVFQSQIQLSDGVGRCWLQLDAKEQV